MAEYTLPADPAKTGNVWCEACQQSLPSGRASAHLSSKKHQQNQGAGAGSGAGETKKPRARATKARGAAQAEDSGSGSLEDAPKKPRARAAKARAPAPAESSGSDEELEAEPKAPRAPRHPKRAAAPGGLSADPNKAGNYWCGICGVSLTATKAAAHGATERHQANERKTLSAAMRSRRPEGL